MKDEKIVKEVFNICKDLDVDVMPCMPDEKNQYLSAWAKRRILLEISPALRMREGEQIPRDEEEIVKEVTELLQRRGLKIEKTEISTITYDSEKK